MADETLPVIRNIYEPEHFPSLTKHQLAVLNIVENPDPRIAKMSQKQIAKACGLNYRSGQVTQVLYSVRLLKARKALWTQGGARLDSEVVEQIKTRAQHGRTLKAGAVKSSELLLELSGDISRGQKQATVNLNAEQMQVAFVQSLSVMQAAAGQTEQADAVEAEAVPE